MEEIGEGGRIPREGLGEADGGGEGGGAADLVLILVVEVDIRVEAMNPLALLCDGFEPEIVISLFVSARHISQMYLSEHTYRNDKHRHHPSRHCDERESLLRRTFLLAMMVWLIDAVQRRTEVHCASLMDGAVAILGQNGPRRIVRDVLEEGA